MDVEASQLNRVFLRAGMSGMLVLKLTSKVSSWARALVANIDVVAQQSRAVELNPLYLF